MGEKNSKCGGGSGVGGEKQWKCGGGGGAGGKMRWWRENNRNVVVAVVEEENNENVVVVVEENNRIVMAVVVEEHNRNVVVVVEENYRIDTMESLLQQASETIYPPPERIVWCYSQLQTAYTEMLVAIPHIEFVKGIPTALEQDCRRHKCNNW